MSHRVLVTLCFVLGCSTSGTLGDGDPPVSDDDDSVVVDDDDSVVVDDDDSVVVDDDDDDSVVVDDDDSVVEEVYVGRCGDARPDGAPSPPPWPIYSEAVCPAIAPGYNLIDSGGTEREFLLVTPSDYDPSEGPLPTFVMWHHLGGDANSILQHGDIQAAADALRFFAIVPEKTGDLAIGWNQYTFDPVWPYLTFAGEDRLDQELVFFDDMLACVGAAYAIDEDCVTTLGVSAGALWAAQLAQRRSDRLASFISLSGGTGPALDWAFGVADVRGWGAADRALPALVLWGGPTDWLAVDFEAASGNLEGELADDGHYLMECVHNCGHGVPPVDPAIGLGSLYRFALDHAWWTTPGHSVYDDDGLPAVMPEWCAPGVGNATIRDGECNEDDAIEE